MDAPFGTEMVGPFALPDYKITVHGYRVPHIMAHLKAGTEGRWVLVLDERFMLEVEDDEVRRWMPFLANAMAVAAGYSAHGENSQPVNPYKVGMMRVGE